MKTSKIGERIRRVTRLDSAPIGFAAAVARQRQPTMLLLLQVPPAQAVRAAEATAQGVDTVIFAAAAEESETQRWSKWLKAVPDVPCGLWLNATSPQGAAAAKEAGADYVVLSLDALASAVLEEDLAHVLALEGELEDAQVRALDGLPLEALTISAGQGAFTLRRLLEVRRLALLSRLPIFLRLAEQVGAQELESLRDAGVVGVLVDGSGKEGWALLAGLRQAIDALPPRRRRREEWLEAVLPPTRVGVAVAEEEEEEEE